MKSHFAVFTALLISVSLLFTACGGITDIPTTEPESDIQTAATEEPQAEPAATEKPQEPPTEAPSPTEPEATAEQVTITLWHGWQGDIYDNYKAVFDRYQQANPGVKIELSFVPDLSDKIVTVVPAGEGPDIVAFANDWIGRLAEAEIIIPLDEYIDRTEYEASFTPLAVESQVYMDSVWGFPESMEAITLIYNKALISEEELPKTTAELLSMAEQWEVNHPGQYYIVYNAKSDAYFSAPWFYGNGGFFVKEDGSVGLNTEGGRAAAAFLQSLRQVMPEEIDYGIADTLFKEGEAPLIINGPWYLADLESTGIDYGLAKLPAIEEGKPAIPFVGVRTLMVTTNCQRPDVAVDVLKFFTNQDSQMFLTEKNKTVPTNEAVAEDPMTKSMPSVFVISEQASDGTPMPNSPYMSALWDPVGKLLQALWSGSDPTEALQTAQSVAEENIQAMR